MIAIDYFTKWIEAIPTGWATDKVIMAFLEDNILSRFGCPKVIITDNVVAFKSDAMMKFFEEGVCKKMRDLFGALDATEN